MAGKNEDAAIALARNMVNVRYEDIPFEAIEVSRTDILDALGVALASSGLVPSCKVLAELVKDMGGKEESSIIAFGGKVPTYMAAFVNAALVHSLNYNDLYDAYGVHPGCTILPVALAVAQRVGKVSGKEFITAYTLGVDLLGRLGRASYPPVMLHDWGLQGFLLTQMFGYFGAAAVAGRLLGLDEMQIANAFGIAYTQSAGNMSPLYSVGADKGVYPSSPAQAGVLSALMAQRGIHGATDSLEGRAGLYHVYLRGEYEPGHLTANLGKYFEGVNLGLYAYPCCGFSQHYITVALRIAREHNIKPQDVKSITVFVGPKAQRNCEPLESKRNPKTLTEAQMSIPFVVATAIAKGKLKMEHLTIKGIQDPEILSLSNKVNWQPDPACDRTYGTGASMARIEVTLNGGRTVTCEDKGFRYGNAKKPISKEDLTEKFRDCAFYSAKPLTKSKVEKIIKMVGHLEELEDVSQITQLVS